MKKNNKELENLQLTIFSFVTYANIKMHVDNTLQPN